MVWLVLVLAVLSAASAADQPPNIIFILADDLVRLPFFAFFSSKNVVGGGLLLLNVYHYSMSSCQEIVFKLFCKQRCLYKAGNISLSLQRIQVCYFLNAFIGLG